VLAPEAVEFWQGRPSRLHDRLRYTRDGDSWRLERLSP
jgi:pyridoxamine 5'-phosphate oxidase